MMETQIRYFFDGDGVTFSFHTCLVCGLDLGGIGSSFTGSLSSSSSYPFHRVGFLDGRMIDVSS
jgi:hypothetical protein